MAYSVPQRVNIRNIKDVHTELSAYVEGNPALEIDLDGCVETDLSLIQLIESARKTAAAQSKFISLTKPANDTVRATLERAGLFDALSPADAKFWLHKEVL
jgi:hypothetical protein